MAFDDKKYHLQQVLDKLKSFKGSGTELISVYVAKDSQIADVSNKLKSEYGQASNIKSKSTRKNVMEALEKIIHHLKIFRQPPENGMAIFCGNISNNESKTDIQLFWVEPHEPIRVSTYRCDSSFYTEPLENMIAIKDSYGVIAMDGKEATLAIVKGPEIKIMRRLNSTAHSKIRKGGQSANRYARLIEESIEKYYQRIGEAMDAIYLGSDIKGIIIGGPGPAKEDFLKLKPFNYQHKILGVVDTGYTDEQGVRETLEKGEHLIENLEITLQRKLFDRFIKAVVSNGLVAYGFSEVLQAIEKGQAASVLVSTGLDLEVLIITCRSCGKEEARILQGAVHQLSSQGPAKANSGISASSTAQQDQQNIELKCTFCGSTDISIEQKLMADYIIKKARAKDIEIHQISKETIEGQQFLKGFRGLGAFLRYK